MTTVTSLKDMAKSEHSAHGRHGLWTAVYTTLCLGLMACGGGQTRTDHYRATIDQQRACCASLGDPTERAACIDRIVTVDDPDVAKSSVNQATFECMNRHFECNPETGQATQASAQAQLDCINDIGQ